MGSFLLFRKKIGESFTKSETITEINPDPKEKEIIARREAVVKELVETEEDFARDMQFVVNNYMKEMDNVKMPLELRDYKDTVFSNFKDICEFHNNVLIKGVQYYASEPQKLGITFLRLERDFDKHVKYCRDEPQAQAALSSGSLKNYFDDFSRKIDDDKSLAEHLKLPIQRINDYVLLIKELIKYTNRLREDTTDLQRALDFMMCVPQRAIDLTYINALEGCCGNVHKLGRLIKHDWFEVIELSGLVRERYVFLFKGRMLITEVIRVGLDRQKYLVKNIIKLQDIEIVNQVDGEDRALQLIPKTPEQKGLPIKLIAKSVEQKQEWSEALNVTAVPHVIEDLGDEEPVLVSQEPHKAVEVEQKIKRSTTQPKHEAEPERKAAKLDEEKPKSKEQTETDAKVEILEDFDAYEEMNTVMTESLRSGSVTSLDGKKIGMA
ncbi:protein Obscurin-like [Tachypleus tridentatus]|uniref:protein Obscurin-like n=1 Tax=Tachypleus tridentatus TaxID=6853 RepID=UPI003FD23E71